MERFKLFLKGVCMGVADIIPGVSGGTLALILGIYAELVNTIKGLHLRWLPAVWRWIGSGFERQAGAEVWDEWKAMNLPFLIILGAGIAVSIVVGGLVIPGLLERHPEVMRALFFGLIVASVGLPLRLTVVRGPAMWSTVGVAAVIGAAAGWVFTAPDRIYQAGMEWTEVQSEPGDTLKGIGKRGPSAWPADQVYWADENEPLRQVLQQEVVDLELERPEGSMAAKSEAVEKEREVYEELEIPAGTTVYVPQPAPWYVFVVGLIAICAMILPGISGSYLLLIFGAYYFVLNSLRAVLSGLADGSLPMGPVTYVVLFMAGAAIGILSFARVMSFLLGKFPVPTLGLLVGLMVGSLRGIWPFREVVDGQMANTLPAGVDATVVAVVIAAVVGALVVTVLSHLGRERTERKDGVA